MIDELYANRCSQCRHWKYALSIANKYGERRGLCSKDFRSKSYDTKACALFQEREVNKDD